MIVEEKFKGIIERLKSNIISNISSYDVFAEKVKGLSVTGEITEKINDMFDNMLYVMASQCSVPELATYGKSMIAFTFILAKISEKQTAEMTPIDALENIFMSAFTSLMNNKQFLEFLKQYHNDFNQVSSEIEEEIWNMNYDGLKLDDSHFYQLVSTGTGEINDVISEMILNNFSFIVPKNYKFRLKNYWDYEVAKSIRDNLKNDDRMRNLYKKSMPFKIEDRIALFDARENHKKRILALEEEVLFNEHEIGLTYKKAYVPLPCSMILKGGVSITSMSSDFVHYLLGLSKGDICFVHGEPGQGKSMVLVHTACYLENRGYDIYYLKLNALYAGDLSYSSIMRKLCDEYELFEKAFEDDNKSLFKIKAFENSIFIFDGLDEIKDDFNFEGAEKFIEIVRDNLAKYFPVVISVRTNLFRQLSCVDVTDFSFHLETLRKPEDRNRVLEHYATDIYHIPFNNHTLSHIGENILETPLLIFLLVWVKKENGLKNLPLDKGELYEMILKTVYNKSYSSISEIKKRYSYETYVQALQIIGYCSIKENAREVALEECEKYAIEVNKIDEFHLMLKKSHGENSIDYLLTQFYLNKGKNSTIYFNHFSFAEYLFCRELVRRISTEEDISKFDHMQNIYINYKDKVGYIEYIIKIFNLEYHDKIKDNLRRLYDRMIKRKMIDTANKEDCNFNRKVEYLQWNYANYNNFINFISLKLPFKIELRGLQDSVRIADNFALTNVIIMRERMKLETYSIHFNKVTIPKIYDFRITVFGRIDITSLMGNGIEKGKFILNARDIYISNCKFKDLKIIVSFSRKLIIEHCFFENCNFIYSALPVQKYALYKDCILENTILKKGVVIKKIRIYKIKFRRNTKRRLIRKNCEIILVTLNREVICR